MSKDRLPANKLLLEFLKNNNIDFYIRKQSVRYMEDNGLVIEPPSVQVFYKDEIKKEVNNG